MALKGCQKMRSVRSQLHGWSIWGREEGKRGEEWMRVVGCIAWVRGEAHRCATSRAVNHICTARLSHWHTAPLTDMGLARQPDGSHHYTPLKANGHDKHWHNKQLVTAVGMDFICRGPAWWWALTSFLRRIRNIRWLRHSYVIKRIHTVVTAISFNIQSLWLCFKLNTVTVWWIIP